MPIRTTRITTWQESAEALRAIRTAVFIREQQIPAALEWDADDEDAVHFLVRTDAGEHLATARLIFDTPSSARAGRFAVLPAHRRQGVASGLLRFIIGFARSQGVEDLHLSAQTAVRELYEKEGFTEVGPTYLEADIPHIHMSLHLRDRKQSVSLHLGSDERVHRFSAIEDYRDHLRRIIPQARQQIRILTRDMETGILDDEPLVEAFGRFCRESPGRRVRLLTGDDKTPVTSGNRLLRLALRLPSRFDLRVHKATLPFPEQVYVLVDEQGLVLRHHHGAWEGFCCYHDAGTVRRLQEDFERLWGQGRLSPEFRLLRL